MVVRVVVVDDAAAFLVSVAARRRNKPPSLTMMIVDAECRVRIVWIQEKAYERKLIQRRLPVSLTVQEVFGDPF